MKQINELIELLTTIAEDYSNNVIDNEELALQLEWVKARIERIEINYQNVPLNRIAKKNHAKPLNQQLFQSKYKAIQSLKELEESPNKRIFQIRLRSIIVNGLYFNYLCTVLNKSCAAYIERNQLNHIPDTIEVFRNQIT